MEPVGSEPHTSRMRVSRATTEPASRSSTRSRIELLGRQAQLNVTDERAVRGNVHADILGAQLALGGLSGLAAQEARTRARSSARRKGFVT